MNDNSQYNIKNTIEIIEKLESAIFSKQLKPHKCPFCDDKGGVPHTLMDHFN